MNSIVKIRTLVAATILLAAAPWIFAMPQQFNHKLTVVETEANAGNPEAQFLLGLRYGTGDGVREDTARAESWLRVAAESGLVEAQSALGEYYLLVGPGYEPEAEKWLTLAADKGDEESTALLGASSAKGMPGDQSPPPEVILKERQPDGLAAGKPPLISAPPQDRPLQQAAPATPQLEGKFSTGWATWVLGLIAVGTLSGILLGRRSS